VAATFYKAVVIQDFELTETDNSKFDTPLVEFHNNLLYEIYPDSIIVADESE